MFIRPATAADANQIIDVHFAAVHVTASSSYPLGVLDDWSRQPDNDRYELMRQAIERDDEVHVVAEEDSRVVGWGCVLPMLQEIRGVYVHPAFGRRGAGSNILAHLEYVALCRGIEELRLDSSLNAEIFYQRNGYEVVDRAMHRLANGLEMASVKMKKRLRQPSGV